MSIRWLFLIALAAAVLGWCGAASAGPSASDGLPGWYLSGQGTYAVPDNARYTDEGLGGIIRLGTAVSDMLDFELVGGMLTFSRDQEPRHVHMYNLGVDALLVFNRDGFSPHLALGGGAAYNESFLFDETTTGYLDAGFGFRAPLIENRLRLRFDVRYVFNFADEVVLGEDQLGDTRISLGVEVPLGGVAVIDADGDNVNDAADQCPNTPVGTRVAQSGCAADRDLDGVTNDRDRCPGTSPGTRVDADGCPRDLDDDGVPMTRDQCPGTAPGVRVDARGCPRLIDSDGDGVPDEHDKCPATPAGSRVLVNGCGVGQGTILQGVNFASGKALLTSSARTILLRVARTLKDSPGVNVLIAGHTDSVGNAEYNRGLSQRRADSVRDFLISRGVDPDRLRTRGFGETQPIANNATPSGRATNRRVELRVVN